MENLWWKKVTRKVKCSFCKTTEVSDLKIGPLDNHFAAEDFAKAYPKGWRVIREIDSALCPECANATSEGSVKERLSNLTNA